MKILLICRDNTCYSPMAGALLKDACRDMDITIETAGVDAVPGLPAKRKAAEVMQMKYRKDLSAHRTKRLDRTMAADADLILCMNAEQAWSVQTLYPEARDKLSLFFGYAQGLRGIYCDLPGTLPELRERETESYLVCADIIARTVQNIRIQLLLRKRKEELL